MIARNDRRVVQRLRHALIERGVPVAQTVLFGSRARGDHETDSDYDVLVIVDWVDSALRRTIADCAWEVSAEEELEIAPIVATTHEMEQSPFRASLLMQAVRRDGVLISAESAEPAETSDRVDNAPDWNYRDCVMTPDDIRVLVQARLAQARESLGDAQALLAVGGSGRSIVNRSYYAMFYSVLALLQTISQVPRRHRGAIGLFDREFIRPGLLPRELSTDLHRIFETRQADGYLEIAPVSLD